MTTRNDPISKQEFYELKREVRELATQSPLRSASITEGRLRVGGSAILLIDSDGGVVIQGSLDGDGNFEWTGAASFTGTLTVSGPTEITGNLTAKGTTRFEGDTTQVGAHHVQGNQDITGTLAVKGAATLENDLRVKAGGKVTVEGSDPVVLGVTSSGAPGIQWSSGGRVVGGASSASMTYSDKTVNVGAAGAILANATNRVVVTASGTTIEGALFNDLPTISATGRTPNVWCDPSTKRFYRLI